jgi:hypothetical protein
MKKTIFLAGWLFLIGAGWAAASERIPFIEWSDVSNKDLSPQARAALSINPDAWRHAETIHFLYHFKDAKLAETVYLHAEGYYDLVKEIFDVREDTWSKKAQIFVFENADLWREFNARIGQDADRPAFTTGWELFLEHQPHWLETPKMLAHEITHVVFFRFLDGPIPLFLNEGFAEFIAYRALSPQADGDMYRLKTVGLLKESEWIELKDLIQINSYPEDDARTEVFYKESELLIRYLVTQCPQSRFYPLVQEISRGTAFPDAVSKLYGMDFADFAAKFKLYAVKH